VQADATLAAQVKFKPLESIFKEEVKESYYQQSDDKWNMPVHVKVANQVCVG
jgi:hypothetical protein